MTKGRVIGLVSGKGGVGKTSITVNLRVALNNFGSEVTVIDTDFSASNLGVHLGRYDHPVKVQHVLQNNERPASAVFRHPTGIKAAVSSNELHHVEPDTRRLESLIEHARELSDYVLVDCPPGIDSMVESIMGHCDELVIVTMPTQTAGINAAQIIEKAKEMRVPILGTIVNMAENDPEMELIDREVEMMTESHIMSVVPYDKEMKKSLFESEPLITREPLSEAALEIQELAAGMEGQQFERPKFPKLKRGLKKFRETVTR